MTKKGLKEPWVCLGLLVVFTAIRLIVAVGHPLFETECYYWMYGQNLGLGYFDHPPMLGYFLHFLSIWDPPSSLAARFSSVFCHFFCSIFLYFYGRNLFQYRKAGIRTALLYNSIPIYSILAIQNQPDAPLFFFWCATLLCFERSLATGKTGWWILVGFAAGGALLSKFHAFPLLGSLALHTLFFAKDRRRLAHPGPYLAAGIALACYLPNFLWNAQNGWITYEFQFRRLFQGGEFDFIHPIGVLLAPFLLLSPWVYGLTGLVAGRILKGSLGGEDRGMALSFWSSFPMFLFFVYVSMSDSVKIHWTAPAFIGILPAVALAVEEWSSRKKVWFYGATSACSVLIYFYLVFPQSVSHSLPNSLFPTVLRDEADDLMDRDWSSQNYGFDRLGEFLKSQIEIEGKTGFDLIASWRFDRAAIAAFYAGEPERAFVPPFGDQRGFTLWKSPYLKPGANALYIERHQSSHRRQNREFQDLRNSFESVGDPILVEAPYEGHPFRNFRVYPCYGLKEESLVRLAMGVFRK